MCSGICCSVKLTCCDLQRALIKLRVNVPIRDKRKRGISSVENVHVCPLLFVCLFSRYIIFPPQEHMARYLLSHLLQTASLTLSAAWLLGK